MNGQDCLIVVTESVRMWWWVVGWLVVVGGRMVGLKVTIGQRQNLLSVLKAVGCGAVVCIWYTCQ